MIATWTLAACLIAAPQAEAAATVTPFVGDEVSAVVRIRLEGGAADRSVRKALGPAAEDLMIVGGLKDAGGVIEALSKAGAKEVAILLDLNDFPGIPTAIIPVPAGADADAIARLMTAGVPGLPFRYPAAETIRGAVVAGRSEAVVRIKQAKPQARPEVSAAFASTEQAPISVVIVPGIVQRRAIEESLANLPEELGGAPIEVLTKGLTWAALTLPEAEKPMLQVVTQATDEQAATALRKAASQALVRAIASLPAGHPAAGLAKSLVVEGRIESTRTLYQIDLTKLAQALSPPLNTARLAAQRTQSVNNLKNIGLALHNYHATENTFPPAFTSDKTGKPLLSWRVLILPFLDANDLYKEFHLDEPWDSEHNKALIARMPKVYDAPAAARKLAAEGKTCYLTPRGPRTAFPGAKGMKIQEMTDGTSNTIVTLEANDQAAVIWTKPDDWEVTKPLDLKSLFGRYPGGTSFGFGDGSVKFIKDSVAPAVYDALITPNGGEVISSDAF